MTTPQTWYLTLVPHQNLTKTKVLRQYKTKPTARKTKEKTKILFIF